MTSYFSREKLSCFLKKSFNIPVLFYSILYLDATEMLGICSVCLSGEATCFLLSQGENTGEPACGHDLCINCVNKLYDCPSCRGKIISFLEVRNFDGSNRK